jgi:hypothetical protein
MPPLGQPDDGSGAIKHCEFADFFVILMIQLLKRDGCCAIVLPDGYKERIPFEAVKKLMELFEFADRPPFQGLVFFCRNPGRWSRNNHRLQAVLHAACTPAK